MAHIILFSKNNNAKKKGGDGDTTKSTHDVSSDTEESLSIDEEDVEFVTKNALFTKRLLANSKELEEEKKGKNDKNKSHGDAKNDEDDDDDDNVERMFFEQEKAKKKEAWEKKQREMLKKKKMKEENKGDEDDDDDGDDEEGDVRLLLPVKRLDGTLVKKPALKDTQATVKAKEEERTSLKRSRISTTIVVRVAIATVERNRSMTRI